MNHIIVRTGAGNDQVLAASIAGEHASAKAWLFDLGAGDDAAVVILEGIIEAPVSLAVLGGDGGDEISVQTAAQINALYVVAVDGGAGDDVIAHFSSGQVNEAMFVHIGGGAGDDHISDDYFSFQVSGTFAAHIDGGDGIDVVRATLGDVIEFDPELPLIVAGFDVAPGGSAFHGISGGSDHDALIMNYTGRVDGRFGILVDGGRAADDLHASFNLNVASSGAMAAFVRGGHGNDRLEVQVRFMESEPVEVAPEIFLDGLVGFTSSPAPMSKLLLFADDGIRLAVLHFV